MKYNNKLQEIEENRGIPMRKLIPQLFDQLGSQKAIAEELGVTQGTISVWMTRLGLHIKTVIIEADKETA